MKSKALILVTVLGLVAFSLAVAGGPAARQGAAGATIGSASAFAAYGTGAGPQNGTGSTMRRGQSDTSSGSTSGSRDRIRKGDGSCGDQGPQQTRKGNRGGKGQAGQ